jgi:hypothetical protein
MYGNGLLLSSTLTSQQSARHRILLLYSNFPSLHKSMTVLAWTLPCVAMEKSEGATCAQF